MNNKKQRNILFFILIAALVGLFATSPVQEWPTLALFGFFGGLMAWGVLWSMDNNP